MGRRWVNDQMDVKGVLWIAYSNQNIFVWMLKLLITFFSGLMKSEQDCQECEENNLMNNFDILIGPNTYQ
jgi:hypothetical protein